MLAMTPMNFLDLFMPRRLSRTVATFALGFAVSESQIDSIGSKLEEVRDRGVLNCGVDDGQHGFAEQDLNTGAWMGFEVDLCRAYAAAFLGDADRVNFVPLTTVQRFDALVEGEVDILIRNTSWTFSRDAEARVSFAGTYYFDGQGFLAPADLGVSSARELDGARICVQPETTTALNLIDYARTFELDFVTVEVPTLGRALESYQGGACDAFTSDISTLAGFRATLQTPAEHVILPDVISKEPLGPVVMSRDQKFPDAVRWVLHAIIAAEEYGVTAANAAELAETSDNPNIRRLLGAEGPLGEGLGLDAQFALRAIETTGHYGELFDRHLGRNSDLELRRGLNAQWSQGGLLYAPPFR
jgi:general L-amino acid transport system substrate-binding protein